MSGRLEFTILGDPYKELGGNQIRRIHWAEWGRRVARWQTAAWAAWRGAGGIQFAYPVTITYTFRRGRKTDCENLPTKPLTDGLKGPDRMILDDDIAWLRSVHTRLETGAQWKDYPEVFVVVEEVDE